MLAVIWLRHQKRDVPTEDFFACVAEQPLCGEVEGLNASLRIDGDDGVFFFDWGRINTAYAMATQMVQLAVEDMVEPE